MYLLDTNTVSELRKRHPDPSVVNWMQQTPNNSLFISPLVIGEIRKGVERARRREPRQAEALESWLRKRVIDRFTERILPVTTEVAEVWGPLNCPDPLPVIDGLLAATALVHDLTLVTRNVKDVERTGVRLLNPFEAPSA
ncbi:type II toxin-antitoxin system VapC family toxin [Streptomyces sp. 6N223]|uniref:type II toxin-antitoxin system VapC family toxin n=1 Tax=Streptomyces sp. 6N223 TaxID=3457412 RepID=UPI003FD51F92